MRTKSLTLEELKASWWWNRPEIKAEGVKGTDWRMAEEPARNYELMRRSPKGRKFKQNYLELDVARRMMIGRLWANWKTSPYRFATHPGQHEEKGWSPIRHSESKQWNLNLPDSILIKQFISEIRTHRKNQRISTPPHANKGRKHRGTSWNQVEVLDRKLNDIGQLNGSDRHTATIARKKAAKCFVEYKKALAEWKKEQAPTHPSYL